MVTPARKIGENLFAIDSFSGTGSYVVDLTAGTCSCPHNQYRGVRCKHLVAVEEQAPRIELLEKARGCSDTQIATLLPRYATDPEVGGALRCARAERKAEQSLRDVFA